VPEIEAKADYTGAEATIPLKTLVLHVTEACNLSCVYCYRKDFAKQNKMTTRIAQKAVDFLFEHCGGLEEVVIVFFGGEPLLNFNVISFTVKYAQSKALENKKKVSFALTTNATLLTERVVAFLHENSVSVTVSMDGLKHVHDSFRCFPDGSPSYDVILSGTKKLISTAHKKPVVARVTVAKDPKNVPETLKHLLNLGFAEAGFAPVTTHDPVYQLNNENMDLLLDRFRFLAEEFFQTSLKDRFFGFTNLIDLLVALHQGEVKNYPCGAGLGLFSVSPDGKLYICQRFTGDDCLCMGDLFNGFDMRAIKIFREQAELSQKKACKTCHARVICAGGCYHEALIRENDLKKPNLHYCKWIQGWIDTGLEVYAKLILTNPDYPEKLCLLRGH
jgi:uncharacterized protein